jgi:hypothetical protein
LRLFRGDAERVNQCFHTWCFESSRFHIVFWFEVALAGES